MPNLVTFGAHDARPYQIKQTPYSRQSLTEAADRTEDNKLNGVPARKLNDHDVVLWRDEGAGPLAREPLASEDDDGPRT